MSTINRRDQSVDNIKDIVGVGFFWPPKIGSDGSVVVAEGTEHIQVSVHRIIMYRKGDLPGIYSFGGGLFGDIFSVSAASRFRSREREIAQAVEDFEDRVTNVSVTIGTQAPETDLPSDQADQTKMYCQALYQVLHTNDSGSVLTPVERA